jgi:2-polyprenyl-3-methyl-5-hydroxy-6-metoxy-1,4-benzoquinol methylase
MRCILCESRKIQRLEKIKKEGLVLLYKKMLGIDINYLISQDIDFFRCQTCSLGFFYPAITGDEKFYNSLQNFDWYYMDEKYEYEFARKFIGPEDKVLEVGCGKGAFAKYLDTKNYVGLDFSENAKKMASKNGIVVENVSIQEYAKSHPGEFDVVVSFQVLEHVSDPKSFLEAKILACRKGGRIIVAVPSENSFLKYAVNSILNMPPHHITRWPDETFYFIAKKYRLNLELIHHEKVQEIHKVWYLSTLLRTFLVHNNKMLDFSLKNEIITESLNSISKKIASNLKDEFLPFGHTVICVFRK